MNREMTLKFHNRILQAEKVNNWKLATTTAYEEWLANISLREPLLCAGLELWYAILMAEYYAFAPHIPDGIAFEPVEDMKTSLKIITEYGLKHFSEDVKVNMYFGYMIKTMPYFFGDYDMWTNKGLSMMKKAYMLDPNNLVAKVIYYEPDYYEVGTPYYYACRELWNEMTPEVWGDGQVQQYFFRILGGEWFYPDAYTSEHR